MPKFSVIIPVYNVQNYIRSCLDSLINQDYNDYEIILIDDGSTDDSGMICDEYKNKYCNIIVLHQENSGVSIARKNGINLATGEYLLFVDSDDKVLNTYFEVLTKKCDSDVVRFGSIYELQDGKMLYNVPNELEGKYSKEDIKNKIFSYLIQDNKARYYCPSLWSHAFKRDLFISNMVEERIQIGEDGACVIPCVYNANSLTIIHDCLYIYRYNNQSATKSKKAFDFEYPMKIYNHLSKKINLDEYDFRSQMNRKLTHELYHVTYSRFHLNEKYKVIKKNIKNNLYSNDVYVNAIKNARFKCLSGKLLRISLKWRLMFIFKIIAKVK